MRTFAARWIFYPETIKPLLHHPLQSMFLGTLPMGLAPIINGIVLFAGPHFGAGAYSLAYALWCCDALLAVVVAVGVALGGFFVLLKGHHVYYGHVAASLGPAGSVTAAPVQSCPRAPSHPVGCNSNYARPPWPQLSLPSAPVPMPALCSAHSVRTLHTRGDSAP